MVITCTTKFTLNNFSYFPPRVYYLFCVDIGGKKNNNGKFLTQNYVIMRVYTAQ
jgi:hypothetical protein